MISATTAEAVGIWPGKGGLPGEHLEEDATEAVEVGAVVGGAALRLLGRDEVRRAVDLLALVLGCLGLDGRRQAQVGEGKAKCQKLDNMKFLYLDF